MWRASENPVCDCIVFIVLWNKYSRCSPAVLDFHWGGKNPSTLLSGFAEHPSRSLSNAVHLVENLIHLLSVVCIHWKKIPGDVAYWNRFECGRPYQIIFEWGRLEIINTKRVQYNWAAIGRELKKNIVAKLHSLKSPTYFLILFRHFSEMND